MFRHSFLFTLICLISFSSFSQATLFSEDFETPAITWWAADDLTPNFWVIADCAGNGTSATGSNSMYISIGGIAVGCGPLGAVQYNYDDAPAGVLMATNFANVDATCASGLQVDFDYKIDGVSTEDFGELVYTTDGGLTWLNAGGELPQSATWTNTTISLPAGLDGTSFELGFRFTYNDVTTVGSPLAVDNVVVTGTDLVHPTATCNGDLNLYVNAACNGIVPDYSGNVTASDNCTATGDLIITQSPIIGTSIAGTGVTTPITLTVEDESGNSNFCVFNTVTVDTISPTITCPVDQNENGDANCQSNIGDYTGLVTTADNCSALFTFSQSPAPGAVISGTTSVAITVEDEHSNTTTCLFNTNVIDITPPVVTCPANITVSTDLGCDYILQDFTSGASAVDNCSPAINLLYSQSPSVGTALGVGVHTITINSTDLSSNIGSCTFDITVEDQVNPTITTCPPNQTVYADASCQGLIEDYTSIVAATDNCSIAANITVSQSPLPGISISVTTPVTITVEDENSNMNTCVFNAIFIDTISPAITCPSDQIVSIDASCGYSMPDLTGLITGADNCSTIGNMSVVQNPAIGSPQNSLTAVLITITDEGGNSASCIANVVPDDTDGPTITCPSPAPIDLGVNCDFTLPNYGTMAAVLDNCSGYSIDQTPAAGSVVNPGSNEITLVVTDLGGNTDQCTFYLDITESAGPTITCPANISTCDPNITYADPVYGDNCFSYLTQTDLSGLSSGMIFPIGTTTLEYTVADSSGNAQTCSFDVEVLEFPSPANISIDTLFLCDQNSTVITADPVTSGTPVWTVFSGQGNFNNQFANSTGVNNLGNGESIFVWTNNTSSCGFTSDTIVVINSQLDLIASTQDTIISCADASVPLLSNAPLYGEGTWSTSGTGTVDDVNSANTFSSTSNGWQDFIWTISNGGCPETTDTLRVFAMVAPTILQQDTSICLEIDNLTLLGSNPGIDQTTSWQVISGSANIENESLPLTDVNSFGLGYTLIEYSLNSPLCPSVSDTIFVVGSLCDGFQPVIPTVFTPSNLDGKNDVFSIDFLDLSYPDCKVTIFNRWGSLVYESIGYSTPWDGRYQGDFLPMGTYFYKIDLNDGSGEILKGDISIVH